MEISQLFECNSICEAEAESRIVLLNVKQISWCNLVQIDATWCKRKAFCMRMRQYGLLKSHMGIFYDTSICRLFSGDE